MTILTIMAVLFIVAIAASWRIEKRTKIGDFEGWVFLTCAVFLLARIIQWFLYFLTGGLQL